MTIYYVSLDGNDSNSGTSILTALKTIAYASTKVISGDTIMVLTGTYNEIVSLKSGSQNKPITLTSYNKSKPAILEGVGIGNAIELRSWNIVDSINVFNYYNGITVSVGGEYNTIRNCIVGNTSGYNIGVSERSKYNLFENCEMFNAGLGVFDAANSFQVIGQHTYQGGVPTMNTIIKNCYFHNNNSKGHIDLFGNTENTLIENCIFETTLSAIFLHDAKKNGLQDTHTYLIIRGNTFNNLFRGCSLEGAKNIKVENNLFDTISDGAIDITNSTMIDSYAVGFNGNIYDNPSQIHYPNGYTYPDGTLYPIFPDPTAPQDIKSSNIPIYAVTLAGFVIIGSIVYLMIDRNQ